MSRCYDITCPFLVWRFDGFKNFIATQLHLKYLLCLRLCNAKPQTCLPCSSPQRELCAGIMMCALAGKLFLLLLKYAKFIECFRQGRVGSVAVITAVNVCTQQALVSFHLHFSGRKSFHHTFELFAQRINLSFMHVINLEGFPIFLQYSFTF